MSPLTLVLICAGCGLTVLLVLLFVFLGILKKPVSGIHILVLCILISIIAAVLGWFAASFLPPQEPQPTLPAFSDSYGHTTEDALIAAQKSVLKKLRAPNTALFCPDHEFTVSCADDVWTVSGYVDSKGSSGDMVRNTFTVIFSSANSSRYVIESCVIE